MPDALRRFRRLKSIVLATAIALLPARRPAMARLAWPGKMACKQRSGLRGRTRYLRSDNPDAETHLNCSLMRGERRARSSVDCSVAQRLHASRLPRALGNEVRMIKVHTSAYEFERNQRRIS